MAKINRTNIIGILVFLSVAYQAYAADITPKILSEKGVLMQSIGKGDVLCVINTGYENGAYWFLLKGMGENHLIGNNLAALAEVHQLTVSPDRKYLAVLSVGEGHPMIEVIDLPKLCDESEYSVLQKIDPYPGTVTLDRWKGSKLFIRSDAPLSSRGEDGRVNPDKMLPKACAFVLNVLTGTIEQVKK
jgi:hypothetical protein